MDGLQMSGPRERWTDGAGWENTLHSQQANSNKNAIITMDRETNKANLRDLKAATGL